MQPTINYEEVLNALKLLKQDNQLFEIRIINGKVACRKVVAFCITKYLNENAEIEDYFIKKGE